MPARVAARCSRHAILCATCFVFRALASCQGSRETRSGRPLRAVTGQQRLDHSRPTTANTPAYTAALTAFTYPRSPLFFASYRSPTTTW